MTCSKFCNAGLARSLTNSYNRHLATRLSWDASYSSKSAATHLFSRNTTVPQLYLPKKDHQTPEYLNELLVKFVNYRKFKAAQQLHTQIVLRNIEITPHPIYEQAAISCLRWDDLETTLSDFHTWFSLVPSRHPMDQSCPPLLETDADYFRDLRRILFASPSTRFPIILIFGHLSATKGYIQPVLNETLPVLIRYAPVNVGTIWLRDMERAILQYSATTPYLMHSAYHFRDLSIKVCCYAGWLSHAMSILAKNPEFELSTGTRTLLTNALRDAGHTEELSILDRRIRPPRPGMTAPPSDVEATPLDVRKPSYLSEAFSTVRMLSRHNVSVEIRFINRQLRKSRNVSASNVTIFLSRLRRVDGGSRIAQWLRERALIAGPNCSIPWLEGELRYHLRQKHYDVVLKLYLAYLNVEAGLPGLFPDMLSAIATHQQFTTPTALPKLPFSQRWIVLKSIVRLIHTLPDPLVSLRVLYESYCLEKVSHIEAYEVRPAFIASFGECGAPDDAVRVLRDSGKAPYSKEVETLAGVLALTGREEKALALLRHVESRKMEMKWFDGRVICVPAGPWMYERVIRGFVRAGLLKPALEAEAMMNNKLRQDFGPRKRIHHEVIGALRALEAQCTSE